MPTKQGTATLITSADDDAQINAIVLDAESGEVTTLDTKNAGSEAVPVSWDGRTAQGDLVESGTYELLLTATDAAGNVSSVGTPLDLKATTWSFLWF